ncbi:MAG: S41 family peptidase [Gemmatimonadales bacterium]|nr:S41 family peptidase [Gemmatimonadales bacterium]
MGRSSLTPSVLLLMLPVSLLAQAAPVPPRLSADVRAAVIDSAVARLARTYVEADTGRMIGDRIKARLAAGAYDRLDNPAQFAEAVTTDLRSLNGDLHLSLRYTPPGGGGPSGSGGPGGADPRLQNFGLGRLEILDGNVGYLEITGFMGAPGYQDAVVDALRFLARTDAVIIDVRRNPGGSGEMSHFVFSHFLGATPVSTIRVSRRAPAPPVVRQSLGEVPGPRRPDVPLFVLTSRATGSAAEEFSFVLKNRKRATIVGTRTAGAGHMVTSAPVGHGFVIGLSITRVSDPETGREWEQVGVQPDRDVAADAALVEAHSEAVRAIRPTVGEGGRGRALDRLLAALDARRRPVAVDPARLARFVGRYEGRAVTLVDGRLRYARREGGLAEELVPLGGDRFALGAVRIGFEERGGTVLVTIEQPDGTQVSFPRGA